MKFQNPLRNLHITFYVINVKIMSNKGIISLSPDSERWSIQLYPIVELIKINRNKHTIFSTTNGVP